MDQIVRHLDAAAQGAHTFAEAGSDGSAVEVTYLRFRRVPMTQTARFAPANSAGVHAGYASPSYTPPQPYTPPLYTPPAQEESPYSIGDVPDALLDDEPRADAGRGTGFRASAKVSGGAPPKPTRRGAGRYVRYGVAGTLLSVGVAFGADRVVGSHSASAVLTGVQVTMRAPIDGVLTRPTAQSGDMLEPGIPYATVENDRADNGRVTELTAAIRIAESEIKSLETRIGDAGSLAAEARRHGADFRATRTEQVAAHMREADANLAAAAARLRESDSVLRRDGVLYQQQIIAAATYDQARRAYDVARADVIAMNQKRASVQAELAAVRAGVYASDNASDRSVSQQNELQMRTLGHDLTAQLAERHARLDGLKAQLADARSRLAQVERSALLVPTRARVLQSLAQSGEYVRQGQEVAKLLDCAQPIVTAEVSESVYKSIEIGTSATFTPADSSADATGRVVQKMPAGLINAGREPTYSVVVKIGSDWGKRYCEPALGRVSFDS